MPAPSTSSGGPRYKLLAEHLMGRIASGELPPGTLLPSELELCDQFNVSRITVRGALQQLEQKGLVSRRAGIGTRVEQPREQPAFTHLGQSVDEVLLFTKGTTVRVLRREEVTVTPALAAEMALPEGQRFVCFEVKRQKRSQRPVVYSHHYVPALFAPSSSALEGVQVSIAQWLAERHRQEIQVIRQQIAAVTLRKAAAAHLGVKPGAPALKSTRWYMTTGDSLLLASVSLFPGDQYTFESTLRRSGT
jgi:DNA-binding GntR family transcriptional regulator